MCIVIWSRTILLVEEMCAMEKEETESPYCILYPHVTLDNGIIPLRTHALSHHLL